MISKAFLFVCLVALVNAGSLGYNYENESKDAEPTHVAQKVLQPLETHNEGYQKHFYYFNAPEEHIPVNHGKVVKKVTTQPKKNLQVVFIKPPEQKVYKKTVQHLPQNVAEEKTHIYVLSKEPDHKAIAKKVQMIQQATVHHHKPDIHFVKYHTPAEAHRIQQSITQQYGGKPSEIVQSGSAPIPNFASTNSIDQHQTSPSVSREYLAPSPSVSQEYLPPKPAATSVVI